MPVAITLIGLGFAGSEWHFPLLIGIAVLLAFTSWLLIERPSLRRKAVAAEAFRQLLFSRRTDGIRARVAGLITVGRARVEPWISSAPWTRGAGLQFLFPGRRAIAGLMAWVGGVGLASILFSHAQSQTVAGVETGEPIYTLMASDAEANWNVMGKARAARDGDALRLYGDHTSYEFQFHTASIPTKSGRDYIVRFSLDTVDGKMGVGASDASGRGWIKAASTTGQNEAFRFRARSNQTQVIIYNNNPTPSDTVATIAALTVSPVR
jgi:hypothetical protein